MIVYRGDASANFAVNKFKMSRYGFFALFFATDKDLAKLYAHYLAKENYNFNGGYVYEFQIKDSLPKISFNNSFSYCTEFRNLIHKLHKEGHKGAHFTDILDAPSKELLFKSTGSDVIVIFDTELILNYKLLEKNVKW